MRFKQTNGSCWQLTQSRHRGCRTWRCTGFFIADQASPRHRSGAVSSQKMECLTRRQLSPLYKIMLFFRLFNFFSFWHKAKICVKKKEVRLYYVFLTPPTPTPANSHLTSPLPNTCAALASLLPSSRLSRRLLVGLSLRVASKQMLMLCLSSHANADEKNGRIYSTWSLKGIPPVSSC